MKRQRSRKGAPGIIEVAKRAGVSPATVSRYYNTPDVVKPPTRRRIEQAATDLCYIRDRMAGSMHSHFSGTFGLIVPTIDNAIFAEMIDAFSSQLRQHDRTMLIAAHGFDLSLEGSIIRSLLERRIDGVVLVGFDHEDVALNLLAERDVPVISIWNYGPESALPCIGTNNFEAGARVTRHLIELGHRDFACLFPDTASNDRARDRISGVLSEAGRYGLNISGDRLLACPYDIGAAKELAVDVLSRSPPTAVLCGNDVIAQGAIYGCHALGKKIPEEISIVGIGDFRGSAHMVPALTTVRLPARKIGSRAADAIVAMSESGRPPEPFHQEIEFAFLERGSTAFNHG